jgi:hypothetical protein
VETSFSETGRGDRRRFRPHARVSAQLIWAEESGAALITELPATKADQHSANRRGSILRAVFRPFRQKEK